MNDNNTKIAKTLFYLLTQDNPVQALAEEAKKIIAAHNESIRYGFSNLQRLHYVGIEYDEKEITIQVTPAAGIIYINDLYLIKQAFGADDIAVFDGKIEIIFKR